MAKRAQPRQARSHARAWGEGTVAEIRPGVWRAWRARTRQPDGGTLRPSRTFRGEGAETSARAWAGGDVEPAVLLLGHWLDRWLALCRPTVSRNTYRLYRHAALACAPLAGRPLAELTPAEWQQLTNALLGRWARYHVAVWRGTISTALRQAVPAQLAENPLARVRLPRPDEQPPRAWTQQEVDRLLEAAAGHHHEPWLLFTLGTGVRLGESRALRWSDLDLQRRTATIRTSADNRDSAIGPTKTRRVRLIDVPDEVIPSLAAHRKRQPPGEVYVFGHHGRPYDANAPRRWLKLRCRAAGVAVLPPHSLRHTYASLALDAGVPVQDVARQLGHTVSTLLRVYAHWLGDDQRRAASAVGKAIGHRFAGPTRGLGAKIGSDEAG